MTRPSDATHPLLLWSTLALKTLEMSTAAAQVIALRTGRMAVHGANPDADDRRELVRMGAEKVDAFSRSGQALAAGAMPLMAGMANQAMRAGMDVFQAATQVAISRDWPQAMESQLALAGTLMRQAPDSASSATASARLAHRALAPVYRQATANAKRLSGR